MTTTIPRQASGTGAGAPRSTDAVPTAVDGAAAGGLEAHVGIAIVGTGFSGLGMAIRLRQSGHRDFVLLERAGGIGGTWRDNRYPGCACDVPSHLYSFSFAPNPEWSRTFSPQPEILDYLRGCAERYGITPHIRLGCALVSAAWDEARALWVLETTRGTMTAEVLISGMGALSEPSIPAIPGLETFTGTVFHSATWREDHDLTGRRVAVIGTGASAIQFVPQIQPIVERLHVFQRTAPWIMPRNDRDIRDVERRVFRRLPVAQRLVRAGIYWGRETYVLGFTGKVRLLPVAQRLALAHLRRQVPDPALRARLTPDFQIGCKRILISNDYLPSLSRPNVEVVTQGVTAIRPHAVVDSGGVEHEVDTIIFGTGFHVTDMPVAQLVRGRGGVLLAEAWRDGASAYLGTTVSGFPNFFMLTGPNTGLGHSSMVYMIESQVEYVLRCLDERRRSGAAAIDVRADVQRRFTAGIGAMMGTTVWNAGGCASWYLDEHGRNTTLWPDFTFRFRRRTRRCDPADYSLTGRRTPAPEGARQREGAA